jgi:hypothetical protein
VSIDSVAEFRAAARLWLTENMPNVDSANEPVLERDSTDSWKQEGELQPFNQVRRNSQEGRRG